VGTCWGLMWRSSERREGFGLEMGEDKCVEALLHLGGFYIVLQAFF
jgi:hypothetical protein